MAGSSGVATRGWCFFRIVKLHAGTTCPPYYVCTYRRRVVSLFALCNVLGGDDMHVSLIMSDLTSLTPLREW